MELTINGKKLDVGAFGSHAKIDGKDVPIKVSEDSIEIDGKSFNLDFIERGEVSVLIVNGILYEVSRVRKGGSSRPDVIAPISGKVIAVPIKEGDSVSVGDTLVVLEAMKMENQIKSTRSGNVKKISISPGQTVSTGDSLVLIE